VGNVATQTPEADPTHGPGRSQQVLAGRLGGLTSWARNRGQMLRIAAAGNEALLSRLGNRSAISLHFTRLAERRWKLEKGEDYDW